MQIADGKLHLSDGTVVSVVDWKAWHESHDVAGGHNYQHSSALPEGCRVQASTEELLITRVSLTVTSAEALRSLPDVRLRLEVSQQAFLEAPGHHLLDSVLLVQEEAPTEVAAGDPMVQADAEPQIITKVREALVMGQPEVISQRELLGALLELWTRSKAVPPPTSAVSNQPPVLVGKLPVPIHIGGGEYWRVELSATTGYLPKGLVVNLEGLRKRPAY